MPRQSKELLVIDRQRPLDPTKDQEDVLGSTSNVDRAIAMAKRAKGEGVVILHDRDGKKREFSARNYNSSDLEFARQMAAKRGEPEPSRIDPYFGVKHFCEAPKTKTSVTFPTKNTRRPRKRAELR